MNTNLQQQNFKEIQQRMVAVPGWEILEAHGILALKSPVATPLNHMVWGGIAKLKIWYDVEWNQIFNLAIPRKARRSRLVV